MAVTERVPGSERIPLSPFRGFVDAVPRDEVGIDQFTGPSSDWLVSRGRIRRRPGSSIFGDTLTAGHETDGILETAIGFLCRRMVSAKLPSLSDGYPTPLMLFTEETTEQAATLAFRNTNGTDAWRTVGQDFGSTHYPTTASSVVYHRVVPMVYENKYGGLTLHRLNSAERRQFLAAGSRETLLAGGRVFLPCYTSCPVIWNGRFNDATGSGTEATEVYPAGLIPPMQVPSCSKGTDLGASVQGPWKGSDAFFYSVVFENEQGELSMFAVPRPPNSAWSGYEGFGYMNVDSSNPTHYYDSLTYTGIPDGPPGTRWKRLLRSGKVSLEATGAGAIVQPSADDLQFILGARIPQGVTTYVDTAGNDLSLDPDPRILDMVKKGLQWPKCARTVGRFDGHVTLGALKPNKAALVVAPWENGAINYPANDSRLYGSVPYFVAVTPENIVLRKVEAGSTTKDGATVSGSAVIGLPDLTDVLAGATISGTGIPGATTILNTNPLVDTGCQTTSGSTSCVVTASASNRVGQLVRGPGIQPGTTVTAKPDGTHVTLSLPASATANPVRLEFTRATLSANASATNTGVTFTISRTSEDTMVPLAGETLRAVVDRINADASFANTSFAGSTFASGAKVIDLGTPSSVVDLGSTVISPAFPSSTKVVGYVGTNSLLVDQVASRYSSGGSYGVPGPGEIVVIQTRSSGTDIRYASQVVPGADADEQADNLLRTHVRELCTYGSADTTLQMDDVTNAEYVTPGMLVSGTNITAGTIVTDVDESTGVITISPETTGTGTGSYVEFYYDTGDETLGLRKGHVRMFGNAFPVVLYWRRSYLDQFEPEKGAITFSGASPGYAQNGINTWLAANTHRGAPDTFGQLMGVADLGAFELQFFASARMRLWNPRTGETHNDSDYTQSTVSWTRGSRSPYAICAGNGVAFALGDDGIYATEGSVGDDRLISEDIYDPTKPAGRRGQLEYAIGKCIAASESDTDDYRLSMQVIGSVLFVRYWYSADEKREIRYDFSSGVNHAGLRGVLRPDGSPYPWSTPQALPVSCSALVSKSDGVHHYAARDTNAGTTDGRVDEIDTGTADNGTAIMPVGYTGTLIPGNYAKTQPLRFGVVARKAGTGVFIGVARDSELDHTDMEFGEVAVPSTGANEYGREVLLLEPGERKTLDAITVRIRDDGSGECPEISRASLFADPYDPVYASGGGR